ncbi:MAG: hypothetical protein IJA34_01985 [Lachnospiraceae bacterium]|nr:hypothetical protein [Lachnospiraceae bacterium]
MKDILFKNITKGKKKLALLLAMVMTVSGIGDLGFGTGKETVHAGETEKVIFAEGYGTGNEFNNNSWKFAGQALNGSSTYDISNNTNGPKIVNNNHSSEQEPIIRLINGVKVGDTEGNESGSSYQDYRSGEAFLKNGIQFSSDSAFSMKFTFSMPDAVVNTDKTGGPEYAREVGGDGIAFVMTTNSTHNTQAGSGIGYQGIDNSVAIEVDSFFNGAYCDMNAVTGTAYKNWEFDNQLYFHKKWQLNGSKEYSDANNPYGNDSYEDDIDYVPYRNYKFAERFDHIGITLNGEVKKHEAIAYINGLDPTERTAYSSGEGTYYKFENLAYFDGSTMGKDNIKNESAFSSIYNASPKKSSIQEDSTNTCSTRFADKNVNNRLFTVWVDYDGSTMYVRYANGNFKTAVRPSTATITKAIDMSNFDGKTVYMGFTSAVGSSKANHTIHSFAFTNEYMADGITTSYKSKYYIESPDATSNYIEENGKKYVCKEELVNSGIELGSSVTIADKSTDDAYQNYTLVDYSSNPSYPKTATVAPDGSTVLYQFYDLNSAKFTCEYYVEVDANTPGAEEVNNKYFVLQEKVENFEKIGTTIDTECDDTTENYFVATKNSTQINNTKKSYQYYKPDYETTTGAGSITDNVRADNSLVFKYYYKRIITKYTEMYYVQDDDATSLDVVELDINGTMTKFVPKTEKTNVVNNVKAGSEAKIHNLSSDEAFKEYNLVDEITQEANGYYSTISNTAEDGTTIVYQFYTKIPKYDYTVEYYVEVDEADKDATAIYADDKWYNRKTTETETKTALDGTNVEVAVNSVGTGVKAEGVEADGTFKAFDGYTYNSGATESNNKYYGEVSSSTLTIQILFDKNLPTTTGYKAEYYIELEDQTVGESEYDLIINYSGKPIKYKFDSEKSYEGDNIEIGSTITIHNESDYYNTKGYDLMPSSATFPSEKVSVADENENIVYQIYRLKPKYTVKYYTQVPEGTQGAKIVKVNGTDKYYKLEDVTFENVVEEGAWVTGAPISGTGKAGIVEDSESSVIVEGSAKGFEGYEFSLATSDANSKLNTLVYRDIENLIELFYDEIPTYTVKYYVEVKATENYDVSVNYDGKVKYYIVKTEETYKKEALSGTIIDYAVDDTVPTDKKAGARENGTNVKESFKSFEKFDFSDDYTLENNKCAGTVSGTNELVIELFYNKKLTSYKEKYYIEVVENPNDGSEIDTIGDKTYKVITNVVPNVPIHTKAKITDKSNDYNGYILLPPTDEKPSVVEDIGDTGNSVVYQVYDLPTYEIKYYKEVAEDTEGAIPVDGKFYVLQSSDTVVNKAVPGTEVKSAKKDNATVSVKEGDKEVASKSYDKYEFSQSSTDANGKSSITVKKDQNVVELFFDLVPEYKVNYYIEVNADEKYDIQLGEGEDAKYYIIKESLTNDAYSGTKVEYDTDSDNKAGVKEDGNAILETFKKFIGFTFSKEYTDKNPHTEGIVSKLANLTINLFFNKNLTEYTEKYYIEVVEIPDDGSKTEKIGDKTYKVITNVKSKVPVDSKAVITDKSNEYKGYKLLDPTDTKPWVVEDIDDTGNTVVYQVYDLPTYTVKYYKQVANGTEGAIPVAEKSYVLQSADTVVNKAEAGTELTGVEKDIKTAVVKEGEKEVENTLKSYPNYEFSQTSTNANGKNAVTVSKVDNDNVIELFYDLLPSYAVKYYVEVKATENYDVSIDVDGNVKYYILKTEETYEKEALTGTEVEYVAASKEKAGVKENGTNVDETFKSFDKYDFSVAYTVENNKIKGTVSGTEELVIELFYNKKTTTFEMIYMTEIVNPLPEDVIVEEGEKKYKVEKVVVPNVPIDSEAEITDKSGLPPYTGYNLLEPTPVKPSIVEDIDDGGHTKVYQVYDLPTYTVKYYKEVSEGTEGAEKVGEKYYKLEESDTVIIKATYETIVQYVGKDDKVTAGVKEGENEVANTFKAYDKYMFNSDATETRGNSSTTVSKDGENVVELFYDKVTYKQKYWVEDPNATENFVEIEINGEIKKFILKETEDIDGALTGGTVDVTDKSDEYLNSDEYKNYELVEVEIPNYPSSDTIKDDNSTVVHQIYVLKPTYEVQYYVEVEEKTDDTIEVDGKFYVIKSKESITNYAFTGTIVSAATKDDKAGVKEADVEVTDTFKKFDGYTFSKKSTDANGKINGEVTHKNNVVIMLMYDLVVAQEEPTTPEETTTVQPTTPSTPVSTGDNVNSIFMILILCSGFVAMVLMAGKKKSEN